MRRTLTLLLAAVTSSGAPALHAQDGGVRPATLGRVSFAVPRSFAPVRELSDGATAVFADSAAGVWLFVATLPDAGERRALLHRIAASIGGRVFGGSGDGVEWQGANSVPTSPFEAYRTRYSLRAGGQRLDLTFRQYRSPGGDVVAGSAFVIREDGQPHSTCDQGYSIAAGAAEGRLTTSLLGEHDTAAMPNGVGSPHEPPPGGPAPAAARLTSDEESVRERFKRYLKALMEHDGDAVAGMAAPAVAEYYAELWRMAVYGTPEQVRALPLGERLEVLQMRHSEQAAKLPGMTPRAVLAQAAVEMEADGTTGTATPQVRGDVAWVDLTWNGKPTGQQIYFVRREGTWQVDFLPMSAQTACTLQQQLRLAGLGPADENGPLLMVLGEITKRPVSPDIWQPLVATGSAPR